MTILASAGSASEQEEDRLLPGDLTMGTLAVRLAASEQDIEAAQALRWQIFYQEGDATPSPEMARLERDFDAFDDVCDHLLVVDTALGNGPEAVVGTYRLIRRPAAARRGGFYSRAEYNIDRMVEWPGNVLELGRSCVSAPYRGRPLMQLLWRGIAAYVFKHEIELMFGCASMPGVDPDALALPLSYLYHNHMAPEALRVRALPELFVDMNRMPAAQIDLREALAVLPPLIKGYMRLGGCVGDGAVIDHQFGTTDVFVIVKTDQVTEKYSQHYSRTARGSKPSGETAA
jgi:putative hemolysin